MGMLFMLAYAILHPTVDQKLELAFGKECEEIRRPVKLWAPERQLVLAAGSFSVEDDGRIRLERGSVALISGNGAKERAFTAVRSERVYLTLDRPAATAKEVAHRKIVAIETSDGVKIIPPNP